MQYRHGSPGRAEFVYPQEPSGGPGTLSWASVGYSGGGEEQIRFVNEGHEYVIYSRVVRTGFGPDGHNEPQEQAGLFVRKAGLLVYHQRCKSTGDTTADVPWIDTASAGKLLPQGKVVYPEE